MYKNYIGRKEFYIEENFINEGISFQVCIFIEHSYNKKVTLYDTSRENGVLVQGESLYIDVPLIVLDRIIFYVRDENLALKLAELWCMENSNSEHKYKVTGVDNYFSVFDS